jgi:hypothetical protein
MAVTAALSTGRADAATGWVFLNGASYSSAPALGATDQVIGRASVATGVIVNGELTGTSVTLSGTRSGLSNIKLWVSSDGNLDGFDSQFGSTVAVDPGASQMEFNGSSIQPSGTTFYLFLTADVAPAPTASGSVLPTVSGMTSVPQIVSFFPGPMDSAPASLPVTVSSFRVE